MSSGILVHFEVTFLKYYRYSTLKSFSIYNAKDLLREIDTLWMIYVI